MRHAALTDPLTGIANRRCLEAALSRAIAGQRDFGDRFGILLIDVDHFKAVNDKHGHATGDAALVSIARSLAGSLRSGDTLGRWGGDEFLVILPDVNATGLAEA